MSITWVAWAKTVKLQNATSRLVLREIADLVDGRGVAIVEVKYLARVAGRSPRTIKRILGDLAEAGLLTKTRERDCNGRLGSCRIQLYRKPVRPTTPSAHPHNPMTSLVPAIDKPLSTDLLTVLDGIATHGWDSVWAASLAHLLSAEMNGRFRPLVQKREGLRTSGADEVMSLAWESARQSLDALREAKKPWGLWVRITNKACVKADQDLATQKAELDTILALDAFETDIPTRELDSISTAPFVGIDDFGTKLRTTVDSLVNAGVSTTLAWAAVARAMEIAQTTDASRRHYLIGKDARLAALGFTPDAARKLMNLIAGTRRQSTNLTDLTEQDFINGANAVADHLLTHA